MAVLGLRFCARAFSSCGKWGPLLITVRGPLAIAASPAAEHRLQTRRLSNCGSRAQPLRGMRDPPRPEQGSNPCRPHWPADSQPLRHQGSPVMPYILLNLLSTVDPWTTWVWTVVSLIWGFFSINIVPMFSFYRSLTKCGEKFVFA